MEQIILQNQRKPDDATKSLGDRKSQYDSLYGVHW